MKGVRVREPDAPVIDEIPALDEQPTVRALPFPEADALGPTRLGTVVAIVGFGLFAQCVGDTLARLGHESLALPLFFFGLVAIFAPCAWRLTSSQATRREHLQVSLVLGVGLLGSYVIRSPLIFDGFDELLHLATLTRMIDTRSLFATNTLLPVSPYYPGLELLTTATKWITGLPLVLAQLVVMVAARVVLVVAVFLVAERVCGSSRAGGIAVLVYAASPQFYFFTRQYQSDARLGVRLRDRVSPAGLGRPPHTGTGWAFCSLARVHGGADPRVTIDVLLGSLSVSWLRARSGSFSANAAPRHASSGRRPPSAWSSSPPGPPARGRRLLDYLSPIFRAVSPASLVGTRRIAWESPVVPQRCRRRISDREVVTILAAACSSGA